MSGVILDTHAFLWFVLDDPRLPRALDSVFNDPTITKALSIASLWEIVIKAQLGKLKLPMSAEAFFQAYVTERDVEVLPISLADLSAYHELPLHHRDPFDRLIIAQAQVAHRPIVTADPKFKLYPVDVTWSDAFVKTFGSLTSKPGPRQG